MELKTIRDFAQYQKDHWAETEGYIQSFDVNDKIVVIGGEEFSLNDNARDQIFDRLSVRGTQKDFEDDPVFLQDAIARKIDLGQKTASKLIYDEKTREAKAVKSTRYNRIYNIDVLDKAIEKYGDSFDDSHSFISDNNMYLGFRGLSQAEIKSKARGGEYSVGDIISFGLQTWNSETGNSSLGVGQLMIRLACTNGMTSREQIDVVRMAHVQGNLMLRLESAMQSLSSPGRTIKLLERAASRPAIVPQITDMAQLEVQDSDHNPGRSWEVLLGRFQIPKRHHEGIIRAHIDEPLGIVEDGVNGWGVYSAVTRYNSHEYRQVPTFTEIESQSIMSAAYPLLTL